MKIETPRLNLRQANNNDCNWIFALNHDPLWLRFIGNRGVHSITDAKRYIQSTHEHIEEHGYGLLAVECRLTQRPFGLCGLINRPLFSVPDLGFALLPEARGRGIGKEAASGVIEFAANTLNVSHLTAMTHVDNADSKTLLTRLGFHKQGTMYSADGSRQILFIRRMASEISPTPAAKRSLS